MDALVFYKSLADDTRLRILLLLTELGEMCVCELCESLRQSQPKISRHLALLRKTGLIQDRRQGLWVYYRLHPGLPAWCVNVLRETLSEGHTLRAVTIASHAMQRGSCT